MKTKHILLVMVAIFFVALTGCKKYPDGPTISLEPKKWRLDGTWKIEQVLDNGQDVTSAYMALAPNYTIEFKSDNTYTETYSGSADVGTWAWNDSKKYLLITPNGGSSSTNYQILKLKHNALWLEYTDGSDTEEIHYVPN